MPTWLVIVIVVLIALVLFLALGGALGARRRQREQTGAFQERLAAVNQELARAHAEDKGWERAELERAARAAFQAEHPGVAIDALHLTQVVDRPGVADDQAVFHVRAGDREHELLLGRSADGDWRAERFS